MINTAAIISLSHNGGLKTLIDATVADDKQTVAERAKKRREAKKQRKTDEEWNKRSERFATTSFHNELVENYLKEDSKIYWNVNQKDGKSEVKVVTKEGKTVCFKEDQLKKEDVAQYREFLVKQLEMIEPPTFMERVMAAPRTLTETKAGKIASAASLGLAPAAAVTAALAARAYGAARHFVMEKIHLKSNNKKNSKSFRERLTDIRNFPKYQKDMENLSYIEDIMEKTEAQKNKRKGLNETVSDFAGHDALSKKGRSAMNGLSSSKEFNQLTGVDETLLRNYLNWNRSINDNGTGTPPHIVKRGRSEADEENARKRADEANKNLLDSETVGKNIARHARALEMIEPAMKTELQLIRQIHQMNTGVKFYTDNYAEKVPLIEAVQETLKLYMVEKQKENKDFSKEDMMKRLNDIDKRNVAESRLEKMTVLQNQLKKSGR